MSQGDSKQFRRYKYNHLDADELRKRREDTSIMLRKQKRDEQLLKKRNVDMPHDEDSDGGSNMQDYNFQQAVSHLFFYLKLFKTYSDCTLLPAFCESS